MDRILLSAVVRGFKPLFDGVNSRNPALPTSARKQAKAAQERGRIVKLRSFDPGPLCVASCTTSSSCEQFIAEGTTEAAATRLDSADDLTLLIAIRLRAEAILGCVIDVAKLSFHSVRYII